MNNTDNNQLPQKHNAFRKLLTILSIPALLIAIYLVTGIFASQHLEVNYYTIPSEKIVNPVRIVHLSDLHSREFGPENCFGNKRRQCEGKSRFPVLGNLPFPLNCTPFFPY